jgi:hypothetical protein
VTVAIAGLLLVQIPPLLGESKVVLPRQISAGPVKKTGGLGFTVMAADCKEIQPVAEFVKVNLAVPLDKPVTKPALLIEAIVGFLLDQVPVPVDVKVVVVPIQMAAGPVKVTTGLGFTVIDRVPSVLHPVWILVYTNVARPASMPTT